MSSSLLITEPPLQVLPSLAKAIGLNEAIVLQQIQYWTALEQGVVKDGRRWIYNSVEEWRKQFPFWSSDTIQRILQNLRNKGLLDAQKLSTDKWKHTLYYSINYSNLQECITASCGNRFSENAESITADCNNGITATCALPLPQVAVIIPTENTQRVSTETTSEIPPTPTGGEEQGQDAFTPEELYSEPLPASIGRTQRQRDQASKNEKRTAIIAAFRHAKYGKPLTDPIAPAEFDKCKSAADDLIEAGADPEIVIGATLRALEEWTDTARVTLRAIAGNLTELTTAIPQRVRPASQFTQREKVAALEIQTLQRLQNDTRDPLATIEARDRVRAQRNNPVKVRIVP